MNFLSHYYLHNEINDNYFTVGLTMPDLLSFQAKRIRINKRVVSELAKNYSDNPEICSFFAGMTVHFAVDSWFHNSDFFKEKVRYIEEKFKDYNPGKNTFPGFYSHILIEILIDRYLLNIKPDVADNFYQSYKNFDFKKISEIFLPFENFDKTTFIDFSVKVANSSFLNEYISSSSIVDSLRRVSKRLSLPFDLDIEDASLALFITDMYDKIKKETGNFIKYAEQNLKIDKNEIIKSEFKLNLVN